MAFDLPANPEVGQVWGGPNGVDYKWDGVKWTGAMNEAGAYLSLLGGTTSGPISVPAGASGVQVPRAEEVVGRSSVIGAIMDFYRASPPENWLAMNGGTHLRADYPVLWNLIRGLRGVGAGDGSTTFVLPNWNGRFRRSASSGGGVGVLQSDEIRWHNHGSGSLGGSTSPNTHSHEVVDLYKGLGGDGDGGVWRYSPADANTQTTSSSHSHSLNISGDTDHVGGNETRPTNVAVLTCIRAR